MKYLPKSKAGAVFAGLYLILLIFLQILVATGDKGVHSGTAMIALLVYFLTLPWSGAAMWVIDYFNQSRASNLFDDRAN